MKRSKLTEEQKELKAYRKIINEEQKELMKKIRKKYRKFRGLYFKKKYLGKYMVMPKIKKVKILFNPNLRNTYGRCYISTFRFGFPACKAIEFNYEKISKLSERELDGVIIHEMLHFIAKDKHGKHFHYLMDYVNRMAGKKVVSRYANIEDQFSETPVDITRRP